MNRGDPPPIHPLVRRTSEALLESGHDAMSIFEGDYMDRAIAGTITLQVQPANDARAEPWHPGT